MTSGEARKLLLEVAREDGRTHNLTMAMDEWDRAAEKRLYEAARDYVDAHRRELDDALRAKLDEIERLGE